MTGFVTRESSRLPEHRKPTIIVGASMTKQSFKDQSDINRIMAKYRKTGLVSHVHPGGGRYEDLPDQVDYHGAMNLVVQADQAFAALPAHLRDRFANEPGRLLAFLADEKNRAEAEQLGLVARAVEAEGGDIVSSEGGESSAGGTSSPA